MVLGDGTAYYLTCRSCAALVELKRGNRHTCAVNIGGVPSAIRGRSVDGTPVEDMLQEAMRSLSVRPPRTVDVVADAKRALADLRLVARVSCSYCSAQAVHISTHKLPRAYFKKRSPEFNIERYLLATVRHACERCKTTRRRRLWIKLGDRVWQLFDIVQKTLETM